MRQEIYLNRWRTDSTRYKATSWIETPLLIGVGSVLFEAVMLSFALYLVH